jgi:hypothetical protein
MATSKKSSKKKPSAKAAKKVAKKGAPVKRAVAKPAVRAAKAPAAAKKTTAAGPGPADLLARLPRLDDVQREAFSGQYSDAECTALGAKTQSGTVRATAFAWAADTAVALADAATAKGVRYGATRLAWLVELIVALDSARGAARDTAGAHEDVRTTRDLLRRRARDVRVELGAALDAVVRNHPDDEAALGAARFGEARTDDLLVASLERLAGLVVAFASRALRDADMRHRLEAACVTPEDADVARDAASDFANAREGVALGGQSQGGKDTPAVNLVEGRVLFEMLRLRAARDQARARGLPLSALIVPPSLDHALARNRATAPVATPTPPAPTPPPPPPAPVVSPQPPAMVNPTTE